MRIDDRVVVVDKHHDGPGFSVRLNLKDPLDCRTIHVFGVEQWAHETADRINAEIREMVLRNEKARTAAENEHNRLLRLTAHDIAMFVATLLRPDLAGVRSEGAQVWWVRRMPGQAPYDVAVSMHDPRFHGLASNEIADVIRREEAERVK